MDEMIFESPFGEWRIRTCRPPSDLAPYVDTFWETCGVVGYGYEKILPSGNADFMVNLGPPQLVLQQPADDEPATFKHAWLSGIRGSPLFTAPAHGNATFMTHFVSASLRPQGVFELFGIDAVDTAEQVLNAEDIFGRLIRSVRDQIGEAVDTRDRFGILANFLRHQHHHNARLASKDALWAMNRTLALQGNVRVEDLCADLAISRKHLNKIYKSAVGMSPKTFARLSRFRCVINRVQDLSDPWVDIAADYGFFDQAHLIRDFNLFAGESPNSFLLNRAPDGESVNFENKPEQ